MNNLGLLFAGGADSEAITPDEASTVPFEIALLRASRRAMATHFEVMLPAGMPNAAPAAQAVLDLIDELEDQLSVFREHSEVSRLNQLAPSEDVIVEGRLFDLLSLASTITRETRGAFDIATGALIKTWGFYKRAGRLPSVAERIEAMNRTGMRHVILDRERLMVRYLRQGLEINLGGIGKGYALDRAAELLRNDWQISSALLHGGTSSVLAVGCPPGQVNGWIVSLRHPSDPGSAIGDVRLNNRALGTSAATYQHFEYNGRKLGHLLDPRKGWPAEGLLQVSATAPTAAEADALSTAFFVMGLEETRVYCRTHPEIGAVVVTLDGTVATFNLGFDEFSAA
jgi:thiamine biosynthesis lipoprotein